MKPLAPARVIELEAAAEERRAMRTAAHLLEKHSAALCSAWRLGGLGALNKLLASIAEGYKQRMMDKIPLDLDLDMEGCRAWRHAHAMRPHFIRMAYAITKDLEER